MNVLRFVPTRVLQGKSVKDGTVPGWDTDSFSPHFKRDVEKELARRNRKRRKGKKRE